MLQSYELFLLAKDESLSYATESFFLDGLQDVRYVYDVNELSASHEIVAACIASKLLIDLAFKTPPRSRPF